MPDLWVPGAIRADVGDHAPCDTQYPPKAIAHITWDRNATAAAPADLVPFANLKTYFTGDGVGMAPHILWCPFTGQFAQFYPADSRSKSVVDEPGGTRTNRAGRVVIQIEAVYFPYCRYGGQVYPRLIDTPCKGWDQLHAWVKSWGVPDAWPMGRPTDFTPHRSESVWETQGGWYGHSQVPENDHQDPGSWPAFSTPLPQEDDMTPDQAAQLKALHDTLLPFMGWDYKGHTADGKSDPSDAYAYLRGTSASVKALGTQVAGLTATVKTLAGQLGSNVDTDTVVAAVQKAIADAVVKVNVDVTGTPQA